MNYSQYSKPKIYTRIRDLREDNDYTQKDLANMLGMYLTQYRRYENGESKITLELAEELSKIYNVSIDYIAGLTNESKTYKRALKNS